jgi:hypothetical protein
MSGSTVALKNLFLPQEHDKRFTAALSCRDVVLLAAGHFNYRSVFSDVLAPAG